MRKSLALLTGLLLGMPRAFAARAATASVPEAADVVTPLNVRDPSALVMSVAGMTVGGMCISAPSNLAPTAGPARAVKSVFDKTGPRPGWRSVGITVGEDQLLSVKPGDRVDLLVVFDVSGPSGAKEELAATILQNVRVLGVATSGDLHGKGVLTLELNALEAQYAVLGARQADMSVAVRAPEDVEIHPIEMAAFRNLFR